MSSSFRPPVTIGVRDSGVGGLTVARRILESVPHARLLYFADTAHVPYGDKTPKQVRFYALSISDFLISQGAQIVVFACNTTSALALESARVRFDVPIIGVIEPGARVAAQQSSGKIGVLATAATVASGVYSQVLRGFNPDIQTREIGCPAFVPLVESEKTEGIEALEACKHYLAPLQRFGADTTILGCTHFPLLLPALHKIAPKMCFIDPAQAVAREVQSVVETLQSSGEVAPHRFWVSGAQTGVSNWISALLPIQNPELERGPVFDL